MLLRVVSWVRVVLAAPVVWVSPGIAWWFRARALASPGRGLVVCWLTCGGGGGCGGFGVLRWQRLLVATLMVGCCRRWCA